MSACAVEDCDHASYCRSWCRTHYDRWRRWGDPLVLKVLRGVPVLERFFSHVDVGDCWIWTASRLPPGYGPAGYGLFSRARARNCVAHRWLWKNLVGPVPDHLQLDHLCRNPPCVNPDHLEIVTPAENIRRGRLGALGRARETRNREHYCPEWALERFHARAE